MQVLEFIHIEKLISLTLKLRWDQNKSDKFRYFNLYNQEVTLRPEDRTTNNMIFIVVMTYIMNTF